MCFRNENTGKIEVGLAEEIYEDQENTDSLRKLVSAQSSPYIISVAFLRNKIREGSKSGVDREAKSCRVGPPS